HRPSAARHGERAGVRRRLYRHDTSAAAGPRRHRFRLGRQGRHRQLHRKDHAMNRKPTVLLSAVLFAGLSACAGRTTTMASSGTAPAMVTQGPNVEFEMMTWVEVKEAMAAGKTTALYYTGGTEQRGPQNVNGGHTLMA